MSHSNRFHQLGLAELRQLLPELGPPPPERRVFVNRTLRLESIRAVGFDLDWTLADYRRQALDQLAFEITIDRLIDAHGYPAEIRSLEHRPDFPCRGLMVDKKAGTVLSMDRHRWVGRAYLGRDRLDRDELRRLYRYEPINPASSRFYRVDTLFELPETAIFSELVEWRRQRSPQADDYSRLFEDVRSAIDWAHAEGPLKSRILEDPERYLRRDSELISALARLALPNRRLFLLTNSDWSYASRLCRHLFDGALGPAGSWRDIFDLVVVGARKPGFFRAAKAFVEVDEGGAEIGQTRIPDWGGIYRGGALAGLMERLDVDGDHVLYVGDHIYDDMVSSKLESTWRTALIVRELEDEVLRSRAAQDEIERLTALRREMVTVGRSMDHLRDVVQVATSDGDATSEELHDTLRETERRHLALRGSVAGLSETVDRAYPTIWGSLFRQGNSKTLFASQLEAFAGLYTARVSNFLYYGSNHYFRVIEDPMTHDRDLPAD